MNHQSPFESIVQSTSTPHAVQRPLTWSFAFRGNAMEYFKIWISNLFLTIITLSLYAPWAKVRRLQYFYGNTYLNRRNFSFTALPTRIFIGRIIALSLFAIISILSQISPEYSLYGTLLLFALSPWLIRSTMRFRARNSKYGNVRFAFSASMFKSYLVLIACALLVFSSLGLAYPIALWLFKRYQIEHLQLGHLKFNFKASIWDFYKAILKPYLCAIVIVMISAIAMAIIFGGDVLSPDMMIMVSFLIMIAYLGMIGLLIPLINAYLFQATWNNVSIGKNKITTDIEPFKFAWIQFSNYIAIIFSFGLLFAWAQIRSYRYSIESLHVHFVDNPEDLINISQKDQNSIAEEISDVFDIDISL